MTIRLSHVRLTPDNTRPFIFFEADFKIRAYIIEARLDARHRAKKVCHQATMSLFHSHVKFQAKGEFITTWALNGETVRQKGLPDLG